MQKADLEAQTEGLPGADLILSGLDDLSRGDITEAALLVLVASPRLRRLGFSVPERGDIATPYEHRLYELIEELHGERGAHSRYNALIRRAVSFSHALEQRVQQD